MKFELNPDELQDLLKYLTVEDLAKIEESMKNTFGSLKSEEEWNGHVFMPGFSPEMAEYAYNNYEPTDQDVFVVSYPKTGTNWTLEIIRQILYQDEEENKLSKQLPKPINVLEFFPKEKFAMREKLPLKRKLTMSHLPASLINMDKIKKANAKVVYVLRNPKDQVVSMYKFLQKMPNGGVEPLKSMLFSGWEKYFDHVVAGDFPVADKPGDWYPDHILSWYQYRDNKNVYFIFYEDMKKDLCKEIKQLGAFLNAPLSDEKTQDIAKACTFDAMRKDMTESKGPDSQVATQLMRKGEVGGWKDHLTVRQSEKIDQIFAEKMKKTDIKFIYEL